MQVRLATTDDIDALARGMREVVEEGDSLLTEPSVSDDEIRGRFELSTSERGMAEGRRTFVLEDEGGVVGVLGIHPTDADGVLRFGMWILRSHRGRGGGKLLMKVAVEEVLSREGVHRFELEAFDDNSAAIALYERFGFEHEGTMRRRYRRFDGSFRSAVIMARLIRPGGS